MHQTQLGTPDDQGESRRATSAPRPQARAPKATGDVGQARDEMDRRRSQVLGILVLAGLLLVYACLRYYLKLA